VGLGLCRHVAALLVLLLLVLLLLLLLLLLHVVSPLCAPYLCVIFLNKVSLFRVSVDAPPLSSLARRACFSCGQRTPAAWAATAATATATPTAAAEVKRSWRRGGAHLMRMPAPASPLFLSPMHRLDDGCTSSHVPPDIARNFSKGNSSFNPNFRACR
jgi:hypothetical protein